MHKNKITNLSKRLLKTIDFICVVGVKCNKCKRLQYRRCKHRTQEERKMKKFMDEDFLLTSGAAKKLYHDY